MSENTKEIEQLINQNYVPSSMERKRTVLMYVLFGIIMSLSKKYVSTYEKFHLKQAIGRRVSFMIILTASVVLFFIKYLNLIPIIVLLPLMIVLGIFVKQARNGEYTLENNKILLPIFGGLGGRVLDIFEVEMTISDGQIDSSEQKTPPAQ
ncbi:MAG TPA: hypothetical protein PKD96_04455 [Candidatus Absconditabacterales bacterium]|nr:hypothetical protein [Candidatus Absconditabacterales bacterium]HMT27534.1 hypothetical protein [Candidatus Absconditabacterales bacterium]